MKYVFATGTKELQEVTRNRKTDPMRHGDLLLNQYTVNFSKCHSKPYYTEQDF